jgi:hypothetical protein
MLNGELLMPREMMKGNLIEMKDKALKEQRAVKMICKMEI